MAGGQHSRRFGSWRLDGHPQVVEYAQAVLDQMVTEVLSAFRAIGHGGVAAGGVLFGQGDRHLVRILAVRPLACDHSAGPSFTLSDNDHKNLEALLANYRDDPALKDLTPVGWFHSHIRSGLDFTPSDVEVHRRHFREPWQIAMIFHPDEKKPTSAAIFVPQENGGAPAEPAVRIENASLPPLAYRSQPAPAEPKERVEPAPSVEPASAITAPPAPRPPAGPLFASYGGAGGRGDSGGGVRRSIVRVAALLAGFAGVWALVQFAAPPEYRAVLRGYGNRTADYLGDAARYWETSFRAGRSQDISLRALASGTSLLIRWDSTSPALTGATLAALEISDGDSAQQIEIDIDGLSRGSYTYQRLTGDVRVRMTVYREGRDPLVEFTRFIGRRPLVAATPEAKPPEGLAELRARMERLRTALVLQADQTKKYEDGLRALHELERTRRLVRRQPSAAKPPAPPTTRPVLVLTQKAPSGVAMPPLRQRTAAGSSRTPASSAALPEAASSGGLIWTGFLPAGETLTITGSGSSTGSLSGRLPGTAVRVSIFPGELTGSGLTVFSSQSRYAAGTVTEEPGPGNSWNRTTYKYDPRAARAVAVVEPLSARNGWNRLVIRAAGRALSVVVVDWTRQR